MNDIETHVSPLETSAPDTAEQSFSADTGFKLFAALGAVPDALTLFLADQPIIACPGDPVAVCILRPGVPYNRLNPVSGAPRLPYCMIGHCFECLVEIDGIANQQACLTVVRDGMKIRRQLGAPLALKHPEV